MADKTDLEVLQGNTDAFFLIVIGIIIFFMQGGFAFLEAGSVRTKNTVNILIKNMLDALIGGLAYWAFGWAFAYGPGTNSFIGTSNFFSVGMQYDSYPSWFFQFVFAATAATIVSGGIAERCQFMAYFIYSTLITGVVYPPVSHWAWDADTPGWLNAMGYQDFAGSGVVHLLGGVCALVGAACIGYRKGRFDANGKPVEIPGHSVPLAALGGFILLFGFLAFNGGSQASISQAGDAEAVARAVVNTILGGCSAGITVLLLNKFLFGLSWSYLMTLNGTLAGMVSMCSGCNVYQPWAAIVLGVFAGVVYLGCHFTMLRFKLDDPLDAVAVHGAGGLLGVAAVPFFAYETGIFWVGNTVEPWNQLGINLLGALCIIVWSGACALIIFYPMRYFGMLRVDNETEFKGNDLLKHGESAYPAEAWVELQYNKKEGAEGQNSISVMSGTASNETSNKVEYNDAFQMVPTQGILMKGVSQMLDASKMMAAQNSVDSEKQDLEKGRTNEGFQS